MGAKLPENHERVSKYRRRIYFSKEMKATVDCCVGIQDSLAAHYSSLKTDFTQVEFELQIAAAILCHVSKRMRDRREYILTMQREVGMIVEA